jgi:hypothetical protein
MNSTVQGAEGELSNLVSSLKEVQALQAQTREKIDNLEKQMNQAPKDNGLPTGECVHWLQTNECKADGPMQVNDGVQTTQPCSKTLDSGWSGFCVCGTGSNQFKVGFDCNGGQGGKTCAEVCKETGASAYGPLPATDAAACLSGGGVFVGQGSGSGYLASDPSTYLPGCPSDSKCCVPLSGTINVADVKELTVTGASGSLAKVNDKYLPYPYTQQEKASGTAVPKYVNASSTVWIQFGGPQLGWYFGSSTENLIVASGPFAKNSTRIPVGGAAEPWQNVSGSDSADASGIRISASSQADASTMEAQLADLEAQLNDLQDIENTLIEEIHEQRLAGVDAESAEAQALRAEAQASKVIRAESEQQRRRLRRERGMEARDNTLIIAANSESLRAKAYTRVTFVAIIVLIVAFIIYKMNVSGVVDKNMAFILAVAAGAAGLIVASVMLSNIKSRDPKDFTKFYFSPPAGPSSGVPGAFSPATSADGNSLQSCRRALRFAKEL